IGSIDTKSFVCSTVAWPPRLGAALVPEAAVGAGAVVAAATTGGGVAWMGTIGATVAGGPLLAGALGVGRHATSNPSPPAPPRPTRNLRRDSSVPDMYPNSLLVHCFLRLARRGSSARRSPSPTKLIPRTVIKIATPEVMPIHGATSRYCEPVRNIAPQLAVGGRTPTPRKDSAASVTMAVPINSVA